MKKLFISQPMNGKPDEEIMAVRAKAIESAEKLIGESVEAIDSFFQGAPADAKPLWYLAKSLELLSTADVAYFVEGWDDARGCRIEHECADNYGILTIEENERGEMNMSKDYRGEQEELKKAAQPLVDFLYKYGSPHHAVIVQMDRAELLGGEAVVKFEIRD